MTVRDLLPAEVKTLSELIGTVVCIMGIGLILFAVWYNEYIMVLVAAAIAGVGVIMWCFADGEPMKCPECEKHPVPDCEGCRICPKCGSATFQFRYLLTDAERDGNYRTVYCLQCGHEEKVKDGGARHVSDHKVVR